MKFTTICNLLTADVFEMLFRLPYHSSSTDVFRIYAMLPEEIHNDIYLFVEIKKKPAIVFVSNPQ